MKIYSYLILICCFPSFVFGQSRNANIKAILKKTDAYIQSIQSLRGEFLCLATAPEPGSDFTIIDLKLDFAMQRASQDSITGWDFKSNITDNQQLNHSFSDNYYKGNNYIFIDGKWMKTESKRANSSFLIGSVKEGIFEPIQKWLDELTLSETDYKVKYDNSLKGKITRERDTVINGSKCYVIKGEYVGHTSYGTTNSNWKKISIRKKDYMPLCSEFYSDSHNPKGVIIMQQQGQNLFKTVSINTTVTDNELIPPVDTTTIKMYDPYIQTKVLNVGDSTPVWELADVNGKIYRSEELNGKVCFVLFSTSTCGWCVPNGKVVKEAYEELKNRSDVAFILINPVDEGDNAKRYVESGKYPFPVLIDAKGVISEQYGVNSYPISFIVDKNGVINSCFSGYNETRTKDTFIKAIEKILKK